MIEKKIAQHGWVNINVDTASSEIISGSGFPKEFQGESNGDYPFAKVGDISRVFRAKQKYISSAGHFISEKTRNEIKARVFPKGAIVFPKIGEALKGNYRVVTSREMLFDNNVMGIIPDAKLISGDFFYYFLTTQDFGKYAVATAVPSVRRGDIASISLSLPPLPEQHRIVAKIEELFSELDKGIENLKTARAQLKVYRQALLKHAFEGKLTAQWRAENQHKLETSEALLKRIQQERAQRYQQQLADWENKSPSVPLLQSGKTSSAAASPTDKVISTVPHFAKGGLGGISGSTTGLSKPKAPKPLPPLTAEELAELPELPEGWGWVRLASIVTVISGYAFKSSDFVSIGVPVVKIANVGYSEFVDKDQEYLDSYFLQSQKDFLISPDDFLLALTRPITNNRTKVCRYPKNSPVALLNQRVSAMKHVEINPEFLYSYFATSLFKESIRSKFSETLQPNLSPKDLEACPIPICSLVEQEQIFNYIEARLSEVDQLDLTITTSLQQAEALRQSILKKAFSGQLVPQDPHDEPASALLARIKAESMRHTEKPKKSISRAMQND